MQSKNGVTTDPYLNSMMITQDNKLFSGTFSPTSLQMGSLNTDDRSNIAFSPTSTLNQQNFMSTNATGNCFKNVDVASKEC